MHLLVCLIISLLLPMSAFAEPISIRILHLNDFHGFALPSDKTSVSGGLGGAAELAGKISILRKEKPALLIAAGDMIQGDGWSNSSTGEAVIDLMNLIKFDVMTIGNHEFDFGQIILKKRIQQASFPLLAANVTGMDLLLPYTIIKQNGAQIAIIGLVTEDTPTRTFPGNTNGVSFNNPLDRAASLIRKLHDNSDLIILLTHIGHNADRMLAEKLTELFSEVEKKPEYLNNLLIIGGHSHTRVETPVKVGSIYVAQAWEHGKTVGVIDLQLEYGKIVKVDGRLDEVRSNKTVRDESVAKLIKAYDDKIEAVFEKVLGTAEVDFIQNGIRRSETNLGDLIADIIRESAGTEVSIINSGSIRSGIGKGEITNRNIYTVLPHNNSIMTLRMNGLQLKKTLEHGVSGIENSEGRFLQVSGIRFEFEPSRPVGKRVRSITVSGTPLDEKREYLVATTDFLAVGGDGFQEVAEAAKTADGVPGRPLRDIVSEKVAVKGVLHSPGGGRIIEKK